MRVEQLGRGEPMVAIVGAIHGDEPCGAAAIETVLDADLVVDQPVKFIIANERALADGVRYIEHDLNRMFPGTARSESYEPRVAYDLLMELAGCTTLSLHSTQSYSDPFAIIERINPHLAGICSHLSIDSLVEVDGAIPHALVNYASVIAVECGRQGTEQATTNAVQILREFLAATGVMSAPSLPARTMIPTYHIQHPLPKQPEASTTVHVDNFDVVPQGIPYASQEGRSVSADESFYPVFLSASGYDSHFGYAADLTGALG